MQIGEVVVRLLSPEEIYAFSVCEVKYEKIRKNDDNTETPADPRLGTLDETPCKTCGCEFRDCPGHFGHIVLATPIIHPLDRFPIITAELLSCFCSNCCRLLVTREMLMIDKIGKLQKNKRLAKIVLLCTKMGVCYHCNQKTLKYKLDTSSGRAKIYSQIKTITGNDDTPVEIPVEQIYNIFSRVLDDDLKLLGINPKQFHPKNLIMRVLPVLPLRTMPYIITDNEKREDDLMTFYRNILKVNSRILSHSYVDLDKEISSLVFYISNFMDNSKKKVRQPNGRAHKSLRELLSSKKGLPRMCLLGKRVHYSSRTVIGGDPTLATDEIFIPNCIASTVSVPETVTSFSKAKLEALLNKGEINFISRIENGAKRVLNPRIATKTQGTILLPGDRVFRNNVELKLQRSADLRQGDQILRKVLKNSQVVEETLHAEEAKKRPFLLHEGDIVHRWLQNGDWVIVNRQPSLHAQSMLGLKVKRTNQKPGKYTFEERSIRLPPDAITPLNADFDGDESNVHNPQNLLAKSEYAVLINIANNIIANQSSRPLIGLVQDALIGCWKMTQGWVPISINLFQDMIVTANINLERIDQVHQVYQRIFGDGDKYLYTGRGILSTALPITFNYSSKSKSYNSESLQIEKGVIISGAYGKSSVGNRNGAIHHFLREKEAIEFLTKTHTLAYTWVVQNAIGVGLSDCIPPIVDNYGMIPQAREHIEASYLNALISEEIISGRIAELSVCRVLNNARSVGHKIASDLIGNSNRIKQMIDAGSKGSMNNLTQIMVALGQNTVYNNRIPMTNIDGLRTLPHFSAVKDDLARKYEERGFIDTSFFNGLNPIQFFNHAQTGREGIVNTGVTTRGFGYIQRKLTAMLKNITIAQDFTVRDCGTNQIVQFIYGEFGFAPSKQNRDKGQLYVDISTAIDKITIEYELKHQIEEISLSEQQKRDAQEEIEADRLSIASGASDNDGSASEDSISNASGEENDFDDF